MEDNRGGATRDLDGLVTSECACNKTTVRMYLRGVWDYRRNRWCQDGRLEVYVKGRSGSLFQKLLRVAILKLRGQSDLMADVSVLENVKERVRINPSVLVL
ncbi:hypothetical protein PIB30_099038 [Stylosanthes scabra]|uniref:Uncharacterized protein n=1 Tax=Stylosanthes scabra TaxID=79078 RepID=A0ABU6SX67_9FABA|nr:hypothetical protein [Stylosanthes scabra]